MEIEMIKKNILISLFLSFFVVVTVCSSVTNNFSKRDSNEFYSFNDEYSAQPVYILISTSSKIYCMKVPDSLGDEHLNHAQIDLEKYEIIYEEKSQHNNLLWITDAFYIKSENLIYVNVYNSSSASSDIFTLKYDLTKGQWVKNVLYRDQSYCLGIAYNEVKKELYWTASKSIIAGSSVYPFAKKTLFHLNSAKKLLYLEFDKRYDTIYVSALNFVYACSLEQSINEQCQVIERNLVSARGLYLDTIESELYVVDHKKRNVKKINLKNNHDYDRNMETIHKNAVILSQEKVYDLGDVFYITLYKSRSNPEQRMIIWSEFSGKIKMANLKNVSNYKVLFSANEFTYSINLMDNSTDFSAVKKTNLEEYITSTKLANTAYTKSLENQTPISSALKTTSNIPSSSNNLMETWESDAKYHQSHFKLDEVNRKIDMFNETDFNQYQESEEYTSENRKQDTNIEYTDEFEEFNYSNKYEDDIVYTTLGSTTSPKDGTISYNSTTSPVVHLKSTKNVSKPLFSSLFKTSSKFDDIESSNETDKNESVRAKQVQNFKAVFKNNLEKKIEQTKHLTSSTSSSSYYLLRTTPELNLALYIVICLLCLSLIINIILLYITKIKQKRNKLIISHEICEQIVKTPSHRSASSIKSGQLVDCNVNLINSSNYSATSYLDPDH